MTSLRREAFQLLASIPEENLFAVIRYLQEEKHRQLSREQRIHEKRVALEELLKLSKPIPDLDDEKELAQYREEKFGDAHTKDFVAGSIPAVTPENFLKILEAESCLPTN